jgi:hypothetical protein
MDERNDVAAAVAETVRRSVAQKVAIGIALLIGFLIFIVLGGIIVRVLWNWLVPSIFGVREVTIWEALGLLTLSRILFGGFSGRSRSAGDQRAWWKHKRSANRPEPAAAKE